MGNHGRVNKMANSNEKTNRNRLIFEEREKGELVATLASKYELSLPRIHRICMKEENKDLKLKNALLKAELQSCDNYLIYLGSTPDNVTKK